ncbi:MAG TPA: YaiI/YqxD family protein [Longimicrobiales bacterium]|nr:YaiI/YqxD family protein [Longimicrobiales bacterium]
MEIYVDADACPVKDETYRVAGRYGLHVRVVTARWMRVPSDPGIHLEVVEETGGLDAADDWIVERVGTGDVVVTEDVHLAARCVEKGALALTPRGKEFTSSSVGEAVAMRDLMTNLREAGVDTGGPAPFQKTDRSNFLQRLDEMVNRVRREAR